MNGMARTALKVHRLHAHMMQEAAWLRIQDHHCQKEIMATRSHFQCSSGPVKLPSFHQAKAHNQAQLRQDAVMGVWPLDEDLQPLCCCLQRSLVISALQLHPRLDDPSSVQVPLLQITSVQNLRRDEIEG